MKYNDTFEKLKDYGFEEDLANCEVGDHYYHGNNYYYQDKNFRIVINMHCKTIEIMCLPEDTCVNNNYKILNKIVELTNDGLIDLE